MSLDGIEHDTIRKPGVYDDPRIHFAVNCASIGCPALRNEAYVADRLDAQLEDQTKRFLSDRSRNRYVPESNTLEVSKIFDWYGSRLRAAIAERRPRGVSSPAMHSQMTRRARGAAGDPRRHGEDRLPRLRLGAERR